MEITVEETGSALIIRLNGHMGHASVNELERVFDEWLGKGKHNIILDMSSMQYISSTGLRLLLTTTTRINGLKGKFLLCGMQQEVRQVFDVSGFTALFSIYDTTRTALKQM